MDAKKVAQIIKKMGTDAENIVRKPVFNRIETELPADYLSEVDKAAVKPTADLAESVREAVLRTKWGFPPTRDLPEGGKQAAEILENRKALQELKDANPDAALLDDTVPGVPKKSSFGPDTAAGKAMRALGAPQRYLSRKAAEAVGLKSSVDHEQNFQNIAEALANKLGVPEDSVAGNVAKAGAVAVGEVFADPLGMIPFTKVAKAVKSAPGVSKVLETGSKVVSPEIAAQIDKIRRKISLAELANVLRPPSAANSTAAKLAAKGAPVVKPTNIIKSRP